MVKEVARQSQPNRPVETEQRNNKNYFDVHHGGPGCLPVDAVTSITVTKPIGSSAMRLPQLQAPSLSD
jgi:hypothetical protein